MNAAPVYDLILQGGHVICPASGINKRIRNRGMEQTEWP
jgi:hypothetical protein